VRFEPKHLLPLDLLEQLLGPDRRFSRLVTRFAEPPAPQSDEEAERTLQELEVLLKYRYKALFYITGYSSPKLVRKKGKLRSEWLPGVIASWLVVHDLKDGAVLCQTQVIVRNDVRDEPATRRMKAVVRERLLRELAQTLRADGAAALGRISSVLTFPATPAEAVAAATP
jgi:hypothetical protein